MKPYRITALKMGEAKATAAEVYWMSQQTGWETLAFWAFLIENDEHRILFNTGFPKDHLSQRKHTPLRAGAGPDENVPVAALEPDRWIVHVLTDRGLRADQVDHILVTPLTAFATGGLEEFKAAQIWISRRGWVDFHTPDLEIPHMARNIVFSPQVLSWLMAEGVPRLRLLPDEESEILPGIRAWFCGGHHRSSMAFVVQTAAGRVALTDAIFKYRNYEENIPLGLSESLEEHYHLFAKLRRDADLILPLYDPLLVERHPQLVIG